MKAAWIYKIPRTWWIRSILVSSAEIWFTFVNFQMLIILSTRLVWFFILAHITHNCEARCSIQFAGAVNKTITWSGSCFKDTVRTCLCFWVIMLRKSINFAAAARVTCNFLQEDDEEDYEYGRINDTRIQSTLVRADRNNPTMYWIGPYVTHWLDSIVWFWLPLELAHVFHHFSFQMFILLSLSILRRNQFWEARVLVEYQ